MHRVWIATVLTMLIWVNGTARSQQPDLPALIERIQPSVVTVLTYDSQGKLLGQGSGFFIGSDGLFVTNVHVLEDAYRAQIKTHEGLTYEVRSVLADDAAADLIVAKVSASPVQFRSVTLSLTQPEIGQSVLISSPLGLERTVSTGIISAIPNLEDTGEVFKISASISAGSSGSPVIDFGGKVIGIATFQSKEGQNLNFAVPTARLPKYDSGMEYPFSFWAEEERKARFQAAVLFILEGQKLLDSNECDKAVPYYQKALQKAPDVDFSRWWVALGGCLTHLRRYDAAIDAIKHAVEIDPDYSLAYNNLGAIYLELEKYPEAIQMYRRAVQISPGSEASFRYLAFSYVGVKRYEDAISAFRDAVGASPNSADAHLGLGATYAIVGRFRDALEELKEVVRIDPKNEGAHFNLGQVYVTLGDRDAALEEYGILRQLGSKQAHSLFNSIYK